jgi:large subunit ribosomal protein L32
MVYLHVINNSSKLIYKAMAAVPKTRISKRRRDNRRSKDLEEKKNYQECPACSGPMLPHKECPTCGYHHARKTK